VITGPPTSGPHTDQCIADAARYGFCDHTRIGAPASHPVNTRSARARAHTPQLSPRAREVYAWIGLVSLLAPSYYLVTRLGFPALPALTLINLGWLLVFTCGLPRGLAADLARLLGSRTPGNRKK
jgi:hypothetical protein